VKWLKRIISKEELPSTVAFDELDGWLDLVSNTLFRGLSTTADKLYGEIGAMRDKLKQKTSKLQDAKPKADIPDAIVKIGLPNRNKLVKNLYSLTEKITIPTKTDYKTVLAFYDTTASNIKFVLDKSAKTLYHVRSLFPDEVKEVVAEINRLRASLNLLVTPLKGKESKIMNLKRVPEIVQDIKAINSEIEKENENVHEQEEECSASERRIESEEKRFRAIEVGEDWIRFKELETELSTSKSDLSALESEIRNLFSPINKELKLLQKQDETGRHTLTSEERRAIASILASPIQALAEDINAFLIAIRNVVEGDTTILKDRKRDKTLNWIDHLLSSEPSALKGKHLLVESRIEETRAKLADMTIHEDRIEIMQSITHAKGQLSRLQEGTARSKRHIVSLEEERTRKERLLLETLEQLAGEEITVNFDF